MEYLMNLCLIQQERFSLLLLSSFCKLKHPATSGLFCFGFPSVLRHLAGTSGNLSVPTVCKQAVLG